MKCHVGCVSAPVVGIANLRGRAGTTVAGYVGVYPLCAYHYGQIKSGEWGNVELYGWEPLPGAEKENKDGTIRSWATPESEPGGERLDRKPPTGNNPLPMADPDPELI